MTSSIAKKIRLQFNYQNEIVVCIWYHFNDWWRKQGRAPAFSKPYDFLSLPWWISGLMFKNKSIYYTLDLTSPCWEINKKVSLQKCSKSGASKKKIILKHYSKKVVSHILGIGWNITLLEGFFPHCSTEYPVLGTIRTFIYQRGFEANSTH